MEWVDVSYAPVLRRHDRPKRAPHQMAQLPPLICVPPEGKVSPPSPLHLPPNDSYSDEQKA